MLYKKRWSDGLHDDFEHLDDFEFKHGCFGGDGGSGNGGSSETQTTEMSAYNETGRSPGQAPSQAQAQSSMMSALSQANQANQTESAINAFNTFVDSGYNTTESPSSEDSGYGYSSISNTALAPSPQSPTTSPSPTNTVGFAIGPTTSISTDTDNGIGSLGFNNAPTTTEGVMSQATDLGFGNVAGTNTTGFNAPVGPGTIGIGTNLSGDIGIGYSMNFGKGGEVPQGIGSLMRRR